MSVPSKRLVSTVLSVGKRQYLVLTSDVEQAGQEAVPESTHLVPQTSVNLCTFTVKPKMFLLAVGKLRPALLGLKWPIVVYIGVSGWKQHRKAP